MTSVLWCRTWGEAGVLVRDYAAVMGLTDREFAALVATGYAVGQANGCAGLFCRRFYFFKYFLNGHHLALHSSYRTSESPFHHQYTLNIYVAEILLLSLPM